MAITTTVNSIVTDASEILQDTSNARWATTELVIWINEAQRVISNNVDDADILRANITSVVGAKQDASTLARFSRIIDVIRIVSTNRALVRGNKKLLDSIRPTWRTETASALTEMWFYDENEPNIFEVYPPIVDSESIEVVYSAVPAAASAGNNITINDKFSPAILEYVLYRSFQKDTEDVASDMGRAGAHFAAFSTLIGLKQSLDNIARPEARAL